MSVCRAQDGGCDSLSQKAADSDGGGSSSAEDKQRCRSELSSPTDVRPPENYNRLESFSTTRSAGRCSTLQWPPGGDAQNLCLFIE